MGFRKLAGKSRRAGGPQPEISEKCAPGTLVRNARRIFIANKTRTVLSLFRTNKIIGILLVAAYAVLLRLSFLWAPLPAEALPEPNPLTFEWLWAAGGDWSYWVATLLIVVQALFLNELFNFYRLSEHRTYLPAAAYVLFCSLLPEFLPLSPEILANTNLFYAPLKNIGQ